MPAAAAAGLLALGPNPALQRVLTFDSLVLGEVNRARSLSQYAGGKGQGVASALKLWGEEEDLALVAHFLGGGAGDFVEADVGARGVEQLIQHVAAPTRTCTTLCRGGEVTELIDPSGAVTEAEIDAALPRCKAVAFCGTAPPGAEELYLRVARRLAAREAECAWTLMVDCYKGIDAVLQTGRVDVLKLNAMEVQQLTGAASVDDAARMLLCDEDAPLKRDGALLAVTDGPRPASLFSCRKAWKLSVPQLQVVNAIGAGDCCTAVFLHSLTKRSPPTSPSDAFAWGLAAGCARCLHELPLLQSDEVLEMRKAITIEESEWEGLA
ncbi:hypothetical protein AB1Y20_014760 [Prymnesium parvum]|uniref:Carbohydrate kinase PfkB domain-containing protein n=1 Tax=Prymnesium parvum TaxID=97485 RepID=A0AB34ID76_PRYPA